MRIFSVMFYCLLFCLSARAMEIRATAECELDTMLGQMIMVGFRGTGEEDPPTDDLALLLEDIRAGKVGGVVLFEPDYTTKQRRNISSAEQVKRLVDKLQAVAPVPLFVAVDQEGGRVRRFRPEHGFPDTPTAEQMGVLPDAEIARLADDMAASLARAGVNLDFAPCVDVNVNTHSPAIGAHGRSFSADARRVAECGDIFANALEKNGVLACFKHFPGHGGATNDSHLGVTDVSATWTDGELLPYRALLPRHRHAMVMIGHLFQQDLDSDYPASLSRRVITGLLRGKLDWDGVVITDDLQMEAIRGAYAERDAYELAINAGVDILLVGANLSPRPGAAREMHAILKTLAREGRISPQRIAQSHRRIMVLKKALPSFPAGDGVVISAAINEAH